MAGLAGLANAAGQTRSPLLGAADEQPVLAAERRTLMWQVLPALVAQTNLQGQPLRAGVGKSAGAP